MLPQAEEPTVPMVDVTICDIPTKIPKVSYDWITHLAECPYCYKYNWYTRTYDGPCSIENQLHRKLDEYNAKTKV